MTRGAISKVLDKLEAKGWITIHTTPGDHRRTATLPTRPAARPSLPVLAAIAERSDEFFSCLTSKEQTQLRSILLKLSATHKISPPPATKMV